MQKILCFIAMSFMIIGSVSAQKTVICTEIGYFNDGLAPVLVNNQWGFVDKAGNTVIEPGFKAWVEEYGALPAFSEGLTSIMDQQTDRVGYINKKGEVIISPMFYSARPFKEHVAFAGTQNEIVLIDTTGKTIASGFVRLNGYYSNFSHNRAVIQKEFAYGYIDKTGQFVVQPVYSSAKDFSNGLAAVQQDGKWGFIDTVGNVKVPFQFTKEPKDFSDYRAFVQGTNNKWGIIDTNGKIVVNPQYHQAWPYHGGVAVVSIMDEKWTETFYIIDIHGKVLKTFPKAANYAETITLWSGFQEGLAVAMKGHKKGFIDPQGKVVVDFLYRDLHPLQDGMAWFELFDDKTRKLTQGYLDRSGKMQIVIEAPMF